MNSIVSRIYDDITHVDNNFNHTFMTNNKGWRYLLFILGKFLNVMKLWLKDTRICPPLDKKHVFIVLTVNQFRSVASLQSEDVKIIRPSLDAANLEAVPLLQLSPRNHLNDLWKHLRYMRNRKDLNWKMYYPAIAYFYYYEEFLHVFKEQMPNSLTITNPTHPILRSAMFAAQELGIPTIYLPHASPSPTYPPILTDYALLEGKDGLGYYRFANYTTKILVGSPRLDKYQGIKPIDHKRRVLLIATNLLDDLEKVKSMIGLIRVNNTFGDVDVILRPHPNQNLTRKQVVALGADDISDSKIETCLEALQKSDILIAGNTTIFFEAIYLPIACFYYDFIKDGYKKDNYRLSSYKFISILDFRSIYSIELNTINNKEEMERIDYAYFTGKRSKDLIKDIYDLKISK